MGLLSGGGGLKGLFAPPDSHDAFAQARAFLGGDYGTGTDIAARRFQLRRRRSAIDAMKAGTGRMTDADPAGASALTLPPVGAVMDGHRFLGGDPSQESSWQPLGGGVVAAGEDITGGFGAWP